MYGIIYSVCTSYKICGLFAKFLAIQLNVLVQLRFPPDEILTPSVIPFILRGAFNPSHGKK